jgi:hypothetical protein
VAAAAAGFVPASPRVVADFAFFAPERGRLELFFEAKEQPSAENETQLAIRKPIGIPPPRPSRHTEGPIENRQTAADDIRAGRRVNRVKFYSVVFLALCADETE